MKTLDLISGCACCQVNRRRFLAAGCAACAGAPSLALAPRSPRVPRRQQVAASHHLCPACRQQRAAGLAERRVRLQPGHGAHRGGSCKQQCPDFEFVTSTATGPEEAKEIVERTRPANRRLPRLPDELLEPGRADGGRVGQARALRRLPIRRQRRIPGVHGRLPARQGAQRRLRRFIADGGSWSRRCSASRWSRKAAR